MLSVIDAQCHIQALSAECHCAECLGATKIALFVLFVQTPHFDIVALMSVGLMSVVLVVGTKFVVFKNDTTMI
jgi:hypothetical protein